MERRIMAKAEDLSGKEFGYLKVLNRAEDHITRSGQKKVCWLCECGLCKTQKTVSAQDLKRGSAISCGCYRSYIGKINRNRKICIICGKEFECPPSDKKVTCSDRCRSAYAKERMSGKIIPETPGQSPRAVPHSLQIRCIRSMYCGRIRTT